MAYAGVHIFTVHLTFYYEFVSKLPFNLRSKYFMALFLESGGIGRWSSGSIWNNFASKAKNVQILNMTRFTLFGDQTFRGRICKIKLAENSRTYLNKHFGVKIISIGLFVCQIYAVLRRLFDDVKNAKSMPIS